MCPVSFSVQFRGPSKRSKRDARYKNKLRTPSYNLLHKDTEADLRSSDGNSQSSSCGFYDDYAAPLSNSSSLLLESSIGSPSTSFSQQHLYPPPSNKIGVVDSASSLMTSSSSSSHFHQPLATADDNDDPYADIFEEVEESAKADEQFLEEIDPFLEKLGGGNVKPKLAGSSIKKAEVSISKESCKNMPILNGRVEKITRKKSTIEINVLADAYHDQARPSSALKLTKEPPQIAPVVEDSSARTYEDMPDIFADF